MHDSFVDNAALGRFEMRENGHLVYASYRVDDATMAIRHVEAAVPLRGTGAAGRLMERVAEEARRRQLRVIPICGYASMWFRRHEQHRDLIG